MVASSVLGADVEVYVDGKLTDILKIKSEMLYNIVKGLSYKERTLLLKIKKPGVQIFTFTLG